MQNEHQVDQRPSAENRENKVRSQKTENIARNREKKKTQQNSENTRKNTDNTHQNRGNTRQNEIHFRTEGARIRTERTRVQTAGKHDNGIGNVRTADIDKVLAENITHSAGLVLH